MQTLVEIQNAIGELKPDDRRALSLWLESQNSPALSERDEKMLLRALDQAMADIDCGKGVSLQEAHRLVSSWTGK